MARDPPAATSGPAASRSLLERADEVAAIRDLLATAREGRPGLCVVSGAAGVGKSSLLAVARREAPGLGVEVLFARGHPFEREFPFGAAVQLFAKRVARRAVDDPGLLSGPAELVRPLLERGQPAWPGGPDAAFPILHGLHWLAAHLMERAPLLLLIDDAQWVDPSTLRYLLYLVERAEGLPLALVTALRTGEPTDAPTAELLAALEAHPLARHVRLRPLGEGSVRRLVRARCPEAEDDFVAACFDATGGNPFLLGELVGAALRAGSFDAATARGLHPASIRLSIVSRLGRLGTNAQRVAHAASLTSSGPPLEVVAELAGVDAAEAAAAADALEASDILRCRDGVHFVHPIVHDAVYAEIPSATRSRWHAAAARLLHARRADPVEVASHLARCDPIGEDWVVPALRRAASVAVTTGGADAAVDCLRRALREPGWQNDFELLIELGNAVANLGDPSACEHVEAALRAAPDLPGRARAYSALARVCYGAGDIRRGAEEAQAALAEIPPGSGGRVEAELVLYFYMGARFHPATAEAARELTVIERAGDGGTLTAAEVMRLGVLAFEASIDGRPSAAVETARVVLDSWEGGLHATRELLVESRVFAGISLTFAGRWGDAIRAIEPCVDHAIRSGDRLLLGQSLEIRCHARMKSGRLRSALADAEALAPMAESFEALGVASRVLHTAILAERGDLAAAARALEVPPWVEERLSAGIVGYFLLPSGRASLALARGDWKTALEQALLCGERLERVGIRSPGYIPWRSLAARAAHALGERDRALALARDELAVARELEHPVATGVALATLGSVEVGARGLEALREAVSLLDGTEAVFEQARARLALGIALRHAGHRRDARTVLLDALVRARRMGATATADSAQAELRLAGGRPRRFETIGLDSLTPSQHRVAELAASGLSNKEIAGMLFVTLRTVETHLTEVYQKLGVRSRDELPGAMHPAFD